LLMEQKYPRLLDPAAGWDGRTLIFELIHPEARVITHYGEREDLVLIAAFDHTRFAYVRHTELLAFAADHGLTPVDVLTPRGSTLHEQLDDLLATLAGSDQEGFVVNLERSDGVIYRVKVKTPDYLRLLRLMTDCTYPNLVKVLDANPQWK